MSSYSAQSKNQQGFITMIVMLVLVVSAVVALAFMHVKHLQAEGSPAKADVLPSMSG